MNGMPQNNIFHSFVELMATSKGKARSSETVGELWMIPMHDDTYEKGQMLIKNLSVAYYHCFNQLQVHSKSNSFDVTRNAPRHFIQNHSL